MGGNPLTPALSRRERGDREAVGMGLFPGLAPWAKIFRPWRGCQAWRLRRKKPLTRRRIPQGGTPPSLKNQ